jgi:hypothetical protein
MELQSNMSQKHVNPNKLISIHNEAENISYQPYSFSLFPSQAIPVNK